MALSGEKQKNYRTSTKKIRRLMKKTGSFDALQMDRETAKKELHTAFKNYKLHFAFWMREAY